MSTNRCYGYIPLLTRQLLPRARLPRYPVRSGEMNRSKERISRRWSTPEAPRRNETSSTEETSTATGSTEHSSSVKHASTPLGPKRSDLEEINRSRRGQVRHKSIAKASSYERGQGRLQRHKERVSRGKNQDDRRKKGQYNRRERRRPDTRSKKEENETSGSESSDERYGESDAEHAGRRKRNLRDDNELPITEILKRSQENARTKYEHQTPLPVLTTDKVYVQHRGGFSAVKFNRKADSRDGRKAETQGSCASDGTNTSPIRVAIMVQQFWKKTGLLYQGLLGGMAMMHFIMLHIFFNSSMEFILEYSMFSEIYTTVFSFLIAMCIVSTFDKFDLARFDVEHIRELYLDYNRAVIAVPIYLVVFCLHQVSARTDDQLNLLHYYSTNDTLRENVTNIEVLLDGLSNWQKISASKDLLAVFGWLFVSLGNKEDSFLMYLRSMEKYAQDVDSSGQ